MFQTKKILHMAFIGLCSFQMACAAMTNNLAKMKNDPGKVAPTGMRINMGLTNQVYVPFLGDMNFTMDSSTPRAQVEKDPTTYRGQNLTGTITPETRAYLERLHANVLAEFSKHLDLLPIEELNAHKNFQRFSDWNRSFNNTVHISLPPYGYPHMGTALIGGGKNKQHLESIFVDLGMVAGINMAYSFVGFHEQGGVAAADLTHTGPAPRSIGIVLKIRGRDSAGSIMLNQTFVGKSDAGQLSAFGDHVDYPEASGHYDHAEEALLKAIREHLGEAS